MEIVAHLQQNFKSSRNLAQIEVLRENKRKFVCAKISTNKLFVVSELRNQEGQLDEMNFLTFYA